MTLYVGPLPAGDERHLKALEAIVERRVPSPRLNTPLSWDGHLRHEAGLDLAAYFAKLADEGVRLVDASEVAEWLRENLHPRHKAVDAFLRRFGGGDEAAPPLNEAGGYGATVDDLGSGDGSE